MKTTDQLVQDILGDVNVKIPELITILNKNISGKNTEIKDILDIAINLKKTMESFAKSIDQIKNLSEYVEVLKETNKRLDDLATLHQNIHSMIMALNDKINKTQENVNKKSSKDKLVEAIGDRNKSESVGSSKINIKLLLIQMVGNGIVFGIILYLMKTFVK